MTEASTAPTLLGGTDHDIGMPASGDDTLASCASCVHPADAHDATSRRWCAATADNHSDRRCICPPDAKAAPVASWRSPRFRQR